MIASHFVQTGRFTATMPPKSRLISALRFITITTSAGAIKAFEITPANIYDRKGVEDLSSIEKAGSAVLGDKGYVSESLAEKLKEQGQTLLALKCNNARQLYVSTLQKEIFKRHQRIETTFSQLSVQLNAQRVLAKSFVSLFLLLLNKFQAFNLRLFLAQSTNIKSLIF